MSVAPGPIAPVDLDRSHAYCERVTKVYARNFYYGLRLLPPAKRAAMYALYAWMRLVDDIADREDGRSAAARAQELEAWRADTHAALAHGPDAATARDRAADDDDDDGGIGGDGWGRELWPAFCDMAARHAVPPAVFDEVIAGQQQDLDPVAFDTFDELHAYCYRVAGVVGLASIYVWGFDDGRGNGRDGATQELAVHRGVAFQLTNILRDLREDAVRGRCYLPRREMPAGVTVDDLRAGRASPAFVEMMRQQVARAQDYYRRSAPLEARISPDSRPTLVAMTQIYHALLRKIERRPARVLRERVSLSVWAKLRIGWRALRARP